MSTTASSTLCYENRFKPWRLTAWRWLARLLTGLLLSGMAWMGSAAWAQGATQLTNLRVAQEADGLYLSASLQFELPPSVQEALLKGIPMSFVADAQINRDRWYWYDKGITYAKRTVRLAYQPLTRRWRVNVVLDSLDGSSGASLSQNFDQLQDAMAVVRRISRWKIAEGAEIDASANHSVEFGFRLDTSQLPRPMQIGITGNADWAISVQRRVRPER